MYIVIKNSLFSAQPIYIKIAEKIMSNAKRSTSVLALFGPLLIYLYMIFAFRVDLREGGGVESQTTVSDCCITIHTNLGTHFVSKRFIDPTWPIYIHFKSHRWKCLRLEFCSSIQATGPTIKKNAKCNCVKSLTRYLPFSH